MGACTDSLKSVPWSEVEEVAREQACCAWCAGCDGASSMWDLDTQGLSGADKLTAEPPPIFNSVLAALEAMKVGLPLESGLFLARHIASLITCEQ